MHVTPYPDAGVAIDASVDAASPPPAETVRPAPLVSVLVRSMGRPLLDEALASIAAQTDAAVEVVVVNAAGRPHPPLPSRCGRFELRLVEPGRALHRAAAANAALRAARGEWLLFLDDDDTIDADHVARLRAGLARAPGALVAYTGVRLVAEDGSSAGTLDEPFDAARLWLANYLPIHAVMFARRLVADDGAHFDESFAVYEDWDFWLQVARRHRFVHVSGASATYRLVGDSGLSADASEDLARQARRAFYRKWLPQWTPEDAERAAAAAEQARGKARDALAAAERAERTAGELHARIIAVESALRESRSAHETLATRLAAEVRSQAAALAEAQAAAHREAEASARQLREAREHAAAIERDAAAADERTRAAAAALAHLQSDLDAARQTYAVLEAGYRAVTASLSWRITAPLRAARRALGTVRSAGVMRTLWRAAPLAPATRQRLKVWLAGQPFGRGALRRYAPASSPRATNASVAPLDKEAVRADAEARLTAFLAAGERIDLRCATAEPAASVVVVLYNQAGLSLSCLRALAASRNAAFETLIVDNASSDRVPPLLERVDGATVLRQRENIGFVRAVNLAAARTRGRALVLLNNDALVEPETIANALARLDAEPDTGAVGGPILWWDGRLQEAGSIIWRDGSCSGYGRGDDAARPEYRYLRDVDYCSGAFLVLRRALFESLGRFDEAYAPAYYEESDYCARLWEAGWRVVCDPRVRVRHFEFASEGASGAAIELQRAHREVFVGRHRSFLAARPERTPAGEIVARQRLRPGARRVLVIDDRVPLPWLGQGYPRAASIVAALAAQHHAVTHYPLQFPHEPWADVEQALPQTVEVMLDHGLAGLPVFLEQRRGAYDTVFVSRPHNMEVLRTLLRQRPGLLEGARIVYDAEALFSLRDIAKAEIQGRPLSPAERRGLIDAEMALARGADVVVAVSEVEAAHYRDAGYADVRVLGHALDVVPATPGFESRRGFVFVGALPADDTPNADSLVWFVSEVWPAIVAALGPDAVLHVVGRCDAPRVRALAAPTVRLHGQVDDLAPHLDAARVFVVPTRYAAGVPHKAHEAAARGLPLVATPLIASQLGWEEIVAVGPDAAAFAAQCIALHGDPTRWRAMREQLLAAVARDCAPALFAHAVAELLPREPRQAEPLPSEVTAAPPIPAGHRERLRLLRELLRSRDTAAGAAALDGEARTAALWGRDAEHRLNALNAYRYWASHPVTAAEINRRISGDAHVGWVAHLQRRHFPRPRRRGISLGCGGGAVVVDALRFDIVETMVGVDIAPAAIERARARAASAGVGARAHFRVDNLNTLNLGSEPWDLILFEQSLHHVDAIDAVLDRCAAALARDGLFVINEYVGPDRFQWSDEVVRLMNQLVDVLPPSYRVDPASGVVKGMIRRVSPQQVIDADPSEAIHSSRILDACAERFDLVERCDFGGTLLEFALADIVANFDPDDERDVALLRLMALAEAELIRAGAIASTFVFAVYRGRAWGRSRAAKTTG